MDKKVLLFDLDGTLLRSDKTISERPLLALEKCREKGILIGVSSGAALSVAYKIQKEYGFDKNIVCILPDSGNRYLSIFYRKK